MSTVTLEERAAKLEGLVDELHDQRTSADTPGRDDWRSTVGMFANDAVMEEILEEAQRIREADRRMLILDIDHLSVLQRPKTPAVVVLNDASEPRT